MSTYKASALSELGVDPFLHAEVGTELNGSSLTVLSLFARLGRDPWTEATRLSHFSRAAVVDCMAEAIAVMPLSVETVANARGIAERLSLLLPQAVRRAADAGATPALGAAMRWESMATVFAILALGVAFNTAVLIAARDVTVAPAGQHEAAPSH